MLVIKIMKELYDSISEYKDAQEKAQSCEQPLPENGSLKSGNQHNQMLGLQAVINAPQTKKRPQFVMNWGRDA